MVLPYQAEMPHGGTRWYGGVPRRGVWTEGYWQYFWKGKTYRCSRLICEAFHGRAPARKPFCLHRDENARNNRPSNLYWGTQKENLNAPGFIAYCKSRTGVNSTHAKARARKAA